MRRSPCLPPAPPDERRNVTIFCRDWTLVKYNEPYRLARPLRCRSWGCEDCQPMRRAQLMAVAHSGAPNRFLTLTINPSVGYDPEERLGLLSHAWRTIVKRLRRKFGHDQIEYLALVEATKAGEPHLHILLRSPYIDQREISAAMDELVHSPIVDIRSLRNAKEVIRYVAKYVTKRPAQFGKSKRYWKSANYEPEWTPPPEEIPYRSGAWQIVREPIDRVISEWCYSGYACRVESAETIYGVQGAYLRGADP